MQMKRTVQIDNYTRLCLTFIAGLLTVLIVALWVQGVPAAAPAGAGEMFVDAGANRQAQLDATKETNQKLTELIDLLKGGQVKVQVAQPEGAGDKNEHK